MVATALVLSVILAVFAAGSAHAAVLADDALDGTFTLGNGVLTSTTFTYDVRPEVLTAARITVLQGVVSAQTTVPLAYVDNGYPMAGTGTFSVDGGYVPGLNQFSGNYRYGFEVEWTAPGMFGGPMRPYRRVAVWEGSYTGSLRQGQGGGVVAVLTFVGDVTMNDYEKKNGEWIFNGRLEAADTDVVTFSADGATLPTTPLLLPVRGTIEISRDGGASWQPLTADTQLSLRDLIRTGPDSRAELRYPDGSMFRLKSDSMVTILSDGIQLQVGESWYNLRKQGKTFQVITPTTVCGVLGTEFSVTVAPDGATTVRVFEGQVQVEPESGGPAVTVGPGEAITSTFAGVAPVTSFGDFIDVATSPYRTAIIGMRGAAIIDGYTTPAGREFRPLDPVKRAQFAKMICGVMELPVTESLVAPFGDLGADDTADLYPHEYVAAAAAQGITKGVRDGAFAPYDPIKRAQVVTMIVRAAENVWPGALEAPPTDFVGELASFADPTHGPTMRSAEYNGLTEGLSGFGPGWDPWRPATRGEVAQILWNLMMR